jgi:ABC-type branched-subunit amino acid transport system substrate-binding protein
MCALLVSLTVLVLSPGCTRARDAETGDAPTSDRTPTTTPRPPGALAGLRGTATFAEIPEPKLRRLLAFDPNIAGELPHAARAYDAALTAGLATELARTDRPSRIAAQIIGVTRDGDKCSDWTSCRRVTDALGEIDLLGLSGEINLGDDGSPTQAVYGVYELERNGSLTQTESQRANARGAREPKIQPDPRFGPDADGTLRIGMVFPTSGDDATIAAASRAGVRLAVDEMNRGGGALGVEIDLVDGDGGSGSSTEMVEAAEQMLSRGADVVIGGTNSSNTASLVGPVTGRGVVLLAPDATATSLGAVPDAGLFFRFAPPDGLQGAALAATVAGEGTTAVTVIAESGEDGTSLALEFQAAFAELGGSITNGVTAAAGEPGEAIAARALAVPAPAIVVLGREPATARILQALAQANQGPTVIPTYVNDISTRLVP